MINSQGTQDLIIYTLGRGQRYEIANRPNVTFPTNLEVVSDVRNSFSGFYQTLFSKTLKPILTRWSQSTRGNHQAVTLVLGPSSIPATC